MLRKIAFLLAAVLLVLLVAGGILGCNRPVSTAAMPQPEPTEVSEWRVLLPTIQREDRQDCRPMEMCLLGGSTMQHDDRQLGMPFKGYIGTQAVVEALTGAEEGMQAYATDLQQMGYYNGSDWVWGIGPHTHVEADITDLDHDAVKVQGIDVSPLFPAPGSKFIYWPDVSPGWYPLPGELKSFSPSQPGVVFNRREVAHLTAPMNDSPFPTYYLATWLTTTSTGFSSEEGSLYYIRGSVACIVEDGDWYYFARTEAAFLRTKGGSLTNLNDQVWPEIFNSLPPGSSFSFDIDTGGFGNNDIVVRFAFEDPGNPGVPYPWRCGVELEILQTRYVSP